MTRTGGHLTQEPMGYGRVAATVTLVVLVVAAVYFGVIYAVTQP